VEQNEFWWSGRVVHVQTDNDTALICPKNYFVHGNGLERAGAIRDSRNAELAP